MLAMGDHDINYVNRNFVINCWNQIRLAPLHWRCPTSDYEEENDCYDLRLKKEPIMICKYDHRLIPVGLNNYNLNYTQHLLISEDLLNKNLKFYEPSIFGTVSIKIEFRDSDTINKLMFFHPFRVQRICSQILINKVEIIQHILKISYIYELIIPICDKALLSPILNLFQDSELTEGNTIETVTLKKCVKLTQFQKMEIKNFKSLNNNKVQLRMID